MDKVFRREWIVPALALAFVSASAEASRDALTAQAAEEMGCNSVSVVQSARNEFLATGCGKNWAYECSDDGRCFSRDAVPSSSVSSDDDETSEFVASALTDLACACASAGLQAHGSRRTSTHASGYRHEHGRKRR